MRLLTTSLAMALTLVIAADVAAARRRNYAGPAPRRTFIKRPLTIDGCVLQLRKLGLEKKLVHASDLFGDRSPEVREALRMLNQFSPRDRVRIALRMSFPEDRLPPRGILNACWKKFLSDVEESMGPQVANGRSGSQIRAYFEDAVRLRFKKDPFAASIEDSCQIAFEWVVYQPHAPRFPRLGAARKFMEAVIKDETDALMDTAERERVSEQVRAAVIRILSDRYGTNPFGWDLAEQIERELDLEFGHPEFAPKKHLLRVFLEEIVASRVDESTAPEMRDQIRSEAQAALHKLLLQQYGRDPLDSTDGPETETKHTIVSKAAGSSTVTLSLPRRPQPILNPNKRHRLPGSRREEEVSRERRPEKAIDETDTKGFSEVKREPPFVQEPILREVEAIVSGRDKGSVPPLVAKKLSEVVFSMRRTGELPLGTNDKPLHLAPPYRRIKVGKNYRLIYYRDPGSHRIVLVAFDIRENIEVVYGDLKGGLHKGDHSGRVNPAFRRRNEGSQAAAR